MQKDTRMFVVVRIAVAALAMFVVMPALASAQAKELVRYTCADKQRVTVAYYGQKKANVTYLGSTYKMKRDVSADGARYVTRGMQWWSKGNGGFLAGASATHVIARACVAKK